jgi:hypothetical protein|tara:strand:+ start:857 stop:2293 length:1437 start_codon:yes stop_codon:yes gene_type:complete
MTIAKTVAAILWAVVAVSFASDCVAADSGAAWLAGDHHIHSRYSVGWNRETDPPTPIIGGDAAYRLEMNALMARYHGLDWMVGTDHGGPNHSKINRDQAYPALQKARLIVPEVIQFYGMELNTPAADHSSIIVAHSDDEVDHVYAIESQFDKYEAHPLDPLRFSEDKMVEALTFMRGLQPKPVVVANHPSRSATGLGVYGLDTPSEFRRWNDTAADIAVGMAGAPGHQALTLNVTRFPDSVGPRGAYALYPTMGGFDQLTARLGGFWDSMLGEGRRWWITANSDSHLHWTEGGVDFFPGEYSKTYVHAEKNYDDILASLRAGRVFVTTGDLISELFVTAQAVGGKSRAFIGQELVIDAGSNVAITIRLRDPATNNGNGDNPSVKRVDLIDGSVGNRLADPNQDTNATTRVVKRFASSEWRKEGVYQTMEFVLENVSDSRYVRVRGTNTDELEPEPDPKGENPWTDLWFYSNPIFVTVN